MTDDRLDWQVWHRDYDDPDSPVSHRLVYSRAGYDWNIWRMPLRDPGPERRPKPFISNTMLEDNHNTHQTEKRSRTGSSMRPACATICSSTTPIRSTRT